MIALTSQGLRDANLADILANVSCDYDRGVVTIRGRVSSNDEKLMAQDAIQILGSTSVGDQLASC